MVIWMPNYSTVYSDSKLLQILETQSLMYILVLGCDGCMNESLAYTNHKLLLSHGEKETSVAITDECQRIVDLLRTYGYSADMKVLTNSDNALCIRDATLKNFSLSEFKKPDIIFALCCPAGYWGLKQCLPNGLIVRITQLKGTISYSYIDDGKRRIMTDCQLTLFE